ncbi:SH3 domain-containing protein [Gluconacetobacter takamatsuzukensis]|uniref:SH3 domain-containing protein n=1 Tax=Gluconacetobacter takamatsuzukensis TaxID=1286190 RepID=A0A7W4KBH5_9PROT|nr:SH3 domain-containing protein [Gluconacetobacter takamatsuzukensis]MBB2203863.1 SH3 domain-containing protein [Gluconacetobacter takamatsuzukensis]
MTIKTRIVLSALVAGLGFAGAASAAPGVVVGGTDIFAGPSPAYPVVGGLPPGAPIEIFGCQPGWGWCDVAGGPYRGWAPSERVQVLYGGSAGPLSQYGPMMGLPLIGFAFGNYWGAHYRDRPWFSSYDRWGGGGRGGDFRGRPGAGDRGGDFHGGPGGARGAGPGGGRSGPAAPPPAGRREGGFPGGGPDHGPGNARGGDSRGGGMPHGGNPGGNPGGNHEQGGHGGHGGDDHRGGDHHGG